ncbi:4Fe-4S binding protein [Candidatus Dependentiae bacterium]|nr:4Fe-4S binding protein [Candidatus Dependentiae bacterium]MBU4386936.1 4Fe-4S binding protein [Candidatus Dependentiae bacterium]MCG2756413.1 4Fe-4S binding protein [Candidatus Dependentiae bacterium]
MENKKSLIKFLVNKKNCAGCGGCIQACPHDAIFYENDGKVKINEEKCQKCGQCVLICPFEAIKKIEEKP